MHTVARAADMPWCGCRWPDLPARDSHRLMPRAPAGVLTRASKLLRPGAPVVRLEDEFATASSADFALHNTNSSFLQKTQGCLNVQLSHVVLVVAKGAIGQGAAEDLGLEGLDLCAHVEHA